MVGNYVFATDDDLQPVCLGVVGTILPIIKGQSNEIPDGIRYRVRQILEEIIDERTNTSGPCIRRSRPVQSTRRKERDVRKSQAREALARRAISSREESVSS